MGSPGMKALIDRHLAGCNAFDTDGMPALLCKDGGFPSYPGEQLIAATNGRDEYRQFAERSRSLFSEREQRITALELADDTAVAAIETGVRSAFEQSGLSLIRCMNPCVPHHHLGARLPMKRHGKRLFLLLALAACAPAVYAAPATAFCNVLRAFVASVQSGETGGFTFRTSWGSHFNDAPEPAMAAKRCEHEGDEPGRNVCAYLMTHGSIEFAESDVKNAVSCLSRGTRWGHGLSLEHVGVEFTHGSDRRGAVVGITFEEDSAIGGMAFKLVAEGY